MNIIYSITYLDLNIFFSVLFVFSKLPALNVQCPYFHQSLFRKCYLKLGYAMVMRKEGLFPIV